MEPADVVERKLKILSAITQVHQQVGAELELGQVAETVTQVLRDVLPCDASAVLMVEDTWVRVVAERGFVAQLGTRQFGTDMPAIARIMATGRSLRVDRVDRSVLEGCVPAGSGIQSLICTPIKVAGRVQGILHLDSREEHAFREDDVAVVEILSHEISRVVERSLEYGRVQELALTDSLTGCGNRRRLEEEGQAELARAVRYHHALSLVMADIDRFKQFNDRYGHLEGDRVLRDMAKLLVRSVRDQDRVYRFGGEEFVVMLPETRPAAARDVAERLRRTVSDCPAEGAADDADMGVTLSLGVAGYPENATEWAELVRTADEALYRAKAEGRNRVCAALPR